MSMREVQKALLKTLKKLGEEKLVYLIDVGAADGLKERWHRYSKYIYTYGFDPRFNVIESDQDGIIFPFALGARKTKKKLNITKHSNLSSFLEPNIEELDSYQNKNERASVVDSDIVEIRPLNDAIKHKPADYIKIDTQGYEFNVLKGGRRILKEDVIFAEVEISFFERYKGIPSFEKIVNKMHRLGFEFMDLYQQRKYYKKNSKELKKSKVAKRSRPGRLAYADALFVKTNSAFKAQVLESVMSSKEKRRKINSLVFICFAYGKVDYAAHYLDRYGMFLKDKQLEAWEKVLNISTGSSEESNSN